MVVEVGEGVVVVGVGMLKRPVVVRRLRCDGGAFLVLRIEEVLEEEWWWWWEGG